MDLVARGVDERCDVAAARCDDSTPVVSDQVAGCRAGLTNFLFLFLGRGVLHDHIELCLCD